MVHVTHESVTSHVGVSQQTLNGGGAAGAGGHVYCSHSHVFCLGCEESKCVMDTMMKYTNLMEYTYDGKFV